MSYIGRLPIKIPEEVSVSIAGDQKTVVVKGPCGELSSKEISGITYKIDSEGSALNVLLEDKKYKRFWGLARTLVSNNIIGVSRQFILKLELIGVGYRVSVQEANPTVLELKLGYSHDILLDIPSDIKQILWQPILKVELVQGKYPLFDWSSRTRQIHTYVNPNIYLKILYL